jgi:hypothetical protein
MKLTGTCPKCQHTELASYDEGGRIVRGVSMTRFICTGCGFSEEWIVAPEDVRKIAEKLL